MSSRYTAAPFIVPVVIIGAGPAGVAASKALSEDGVASLMLEATGKIGGQAAPETLQRYISDFGVFKRAHTHAPVWSVDRRRDGTFLVSYTHYGKPQQVIAQRVVVSTGLDAAGAFLSAAMRDPSQPTPGLVFHGASHPNVSLPALEQRLRSAVRPQRACAAAP